MMPDSSTYEGLVDQLHRIGVATGAWDAASESLPQTILRGLNMGMQGQGAALGAMPTIEGVPNLSIGRTAAAPRPANIAGMSQAEIKNMLEAQRQPETYADYVYNKVRSWATPDDILNSDALWYMAQQKANTGVDFSQAFADLANEVWSRMGANRYITPRMAQSHINRERASLAGIQLVPVEHDPFAGSPPE